MLPSRPRRLETVDHPMRIAVNRPIEAVRVKSDRAFRWWIAELRAVWSETAQRLRQARGGGISIEAGERQWLLRRPKQPTANFDTAAFDPQMLREMVGTAGPVTVLIPPE